MKHCLSCGKQMTRREKERPAEFRRRSYCGLKCSVADRSRKAVEKQLAADLENAYPQLNPGALDFDRNEILTRAHMAAPQIPVSLIADVVDAVEPMISANTRRKLMALVALDVRAKRVYP